MEPRTMSTAQEANFNEHKEAVSKVTAGTGRSKGDGSANDKKTENNN